VVNDEEMLLVALCNDHTYKKRGQEKKGMEELCLRKIEKRNGRVKRK
jgi:hypothetical protein